MKPSLMILFNISPARLRELSPAALASGFALRPATNREHRVPIGSVTGPAAEDPMFQPAFREEMLVFACPGNEQVFAFLDRLRKDGVTPPALKAVITPANRLWTAERLCRELKAEQRTLERRSDPHS